MLAPVIEDVEEAKEAEEVKDPALASGASR
jgi:hypothetical protein